VSDDALDDFGREFEPDADQDFVFAFAAKRGDFALKVQSAHIAVLKFWIGFVTAELGDDWIVVDGTRTQNFHVINLSRLCRSSRPERPELDAAACRFLPFDLER
jgi:hypothetical protein